MESTLDHPVFALSDPVLVISHDQEALSVVRGTHVTASVQHADTELFGVGVSDLSLVSDLLGHEVFKSVGWKRRKLLKIL